MKNNTKSQKSLILQALKQNKQVSRNWALSQNITRLGAIIHTLKNEGHSIYAMGTNRRGNDYIYKYVE